MKLRKVSLNWLRSGRAESARSKAQSQVKFWIRMACSENLYKPLFLPEIIMKLRQDAKEKVGK